MRLIALLLIFPAIGFADIHVEFTFDVKTPPPRRVAKLWAKPGMLLIEHVDKKRTLIRFDLNYSFTSERGRLTGYKKLKKEHQPAAPIKVVKGDDAKVAGAATTHFKLVNASGKTVMEIWAHASAEGADPWGRYMRLKLPPIKGMEQVKGVWLQSKTLYGDGFITSTASKVDVAALPDSVFKIPGSGATPDAEVVKRWEADALQRRRLQRLYWLVRDRYPRSHGKKLPPLKRLLSALYTSGVETSLETFACARGGKAPTAEDLKANRLEALGFVSTPYPIRTELAASEFPIIWDRGFNGRRFVVFYDGHVEEMAEAAFQKSLARAKEWDARYKAKGAASKHQAD